METEQQISYTPNTKNYSFIVFDFINDTGKLLLSNREDKKEALILATEWLDTLVSPFFDEEQKDTELSAQISKLREAIINNEKSDVIIREFQIIFKEVKFILATMQDNNLLPPRVYYPILAHKGTKAYEYFKTLGAIDESIGSGSPEEA